MTVYSLPEAMDWNEDGLIDLIHCGKNGGYSDPNILLYINEGTATNYKFGTPVHVLSNGTPMYHISPPTPHVIDYNRDGNKDLMIGTFSGKIAYYQNEGANNAPLFNDPTYLTHGPNDDNEIFVAKTWQGSSTPEIKQHFCDWNKDGYWDIIMGGGKSVIELFISYGKPETSLKQNICINSKSLITVRNRNNIISFTNNNNETIDFEIFNANGIKIINNHKLVSGSNYQLSENYSKGVYFIKVKVKNQIKIKRFIIK